MIEAKWNCLASTATPADWCDEKFASEVAPDGNSIAIFRTVCIADDITRGNNCGADTRNNRRGHLAVAGFGVGGQEDADIFVDDAVVMFEIWFFAHDFDPRRAQSARLSQQEMAERAGTLRTTLSAYEHDRKSPNLETFEKLLDVAG